MALIKCPECDKDVSKKAVSCPHCGYPLTVIQDKAIPPPISNTKANKNKKVGCGCGLISIIFLIVVFSAMWSLPPSTTSSSAQYSQELTEKAQRAIYIAGVSTAIHDLYADTDGIVQIRLNLKKDNLGGEVHVDDTVKGLTWIMFKVPEVKGVYILDANNDFLGGDTR